MALYPNEIVIDDDTPSDLLHRFKVDGEIMATGCVPRDYSISPKEMFASPDEMKLIPKSEWSERIKEQEARKSRLSDIILRSGVPSLSQGQNGYCWAFSTGAAIMFDRLKSGQAPIILNPCGPAAIIKRGANQGGWSALSAEWMRENGCPTAEFWPGNSRALSNDTAAMRANAALHKITEDWVDLSQSVYDRDLTFDQVATCLLQNIPVAADFNHWGHAICLTDLVEVEPGSFGVRFRNSWGDSFGVRGFGVLQGRKAIPDNAIAVRVSRGANK